MREAEGAVEAIRSGLVVSCQATPGHPMDNLEATVMLARCAQRGGAVGLRVNSPAGVAAVKELVDLPVIGIDKVWQEGGRALITPALTRAVGLAEAGADIIAIEATTESGGAWLVEAAKRELAVPLIADVSTLDEGLLALEAGADLVASTLSGYTRATAGGDGRPDLDLVAELVAAGARVVAEGRLRTPDQAAEAIRRGAWCVVIGAAITDPVSLTSRYARAVATAGTST